MGNILRLLIFGILLTVLSICASAQDLGSSNKLFGGEKHTPGATSRAVKKAPAKKPSATAKTKATGNTKSKTTAKKNIPESKSTKLPQAQASAAGKPKDTENKDRKKIEITPAKVDPPVVVSPAVENLFEDLIEEGNAARDARNYPAAEAAYKRAKPLKPRDARAIYGLGNLYSDQQRWEESENAYRTALEIDPASANVHVALSYVLTQPVAAPNLSDRYQEAEKLARRAIQLEPANPLAFDQLGVALELRGEIASETENAYRRSIQLDPSFAPAYAHLGRLLRRRGLTKDSEVSYENAIKRSTDVATMVLVADVMQSEQRFAESEKLVQKAIDDDPRNPSALLLLGRALTAQGKFSDAERVLRSSLDVSPNRFMANSLLGSLFARQGKFELAENALLQALRFASTFEKRLLSQQFEAVGDGYMKTAKRQLAERAYRQAIGLDSERGSLAGKLSKARFG